MIPFPHRLLFAIKVYSSIAIAIFCLIFLLIALYLNAKFRRKPLGKPFRYLRNFTLCLFVLLGGFFLYSCYLFETAPQLTKENGELTLGLTSRVNEILESSKLRKDFKKHYFFKKLSSPVFYSEETKIKLHSSNDSNIFVLGGNLGAESSNFRINLVSQEIRGAIDNIKFGRISVDLGGLYRFQLISNAFSDINHLNTYLDRMVEEIKRLYPSLNFIKDDRAILNTRDSIETYFNNQIFTATITDRFIYNLNVILRKRPYINLIKNDTILMERGDDLNQPSYYLEINLQRSDLPLCKEGQSPVLATVVDYGTYEADDKLVDSTSITVDNENVAGGLMAVGELKHLSSNLNIRASLGVDFGFRYTLIRNCLTEDEKFNNLYDLPVTIKVTHPKEIYDPKARKKFKHSKWGEVVPVSTTYKEHINYNTGWIFSNDWEMVDGPWTIELYERDNKLAEKTFNIMK